MLKHSWLICFTISFFTAAAQKISIGQQCTDYTSSAVINYSDTVIRLSGFSGKWVVIDFWNHSCISCIRDFEKLEALQKKFNGSIQIILANNESKDSTLRFFAKHKKIKMPALPLISSAWDLWSLFTDDKAPYHLWLDQDRKVQYITGPYNLTAGHIESLLAGEKPFMADYTLEEGATGGAVDNALYHSAISHCDIPARKYEMEAETVNNGQSVHMCSPCYSVSDLYKKAYSEYDKYRFSTAGRVILEMTDTRPFMYPQDQDLLDEWQQRYSYTYDLLIPAAAKDQRYKFMQQDIKRYFGLSASVEKRKLKCMALIATGDISKLITKGGEPVNKLFIAGLSKQPEDTVRYITNQPFRNFIEHMDAWIEYQFQIPFIDKTGFKGNIDLRLKDSSVDPFDLAALRNELKRYNLKLIETTAWMDVLVIKPGKQ